MGWSTSQDRRFLRHCETGSSLCQGWVTHGRDGGRQDLATWAVSHSSRFCSPQGNPRPMWHVVELFSKQLQTSSLYGYLLKSNGPYHLIHTAFRVWCVLILPAPAAQAMVSRLQRSDAGGTTSLLLFPPCSSWTCQAPGASNIRWNRTPLPPSRANPGL